MNVQEPIRPRLFFIECAGSHYVIRATDEAEAWAVLISENRYAARYRSLVPMEELDADGPPAVILEGPC